MVSQFFFNLIVVIVALFLSHSEDVSVVFPWECEIDDETAAEIEQESLDAYYNPEATGIFGHNDHYGWPYYIDESDRDGDPNYEAWL